MTPTLFNRKIFACTFGHLLVSAQKVLGVLLLGVRLWRNVWKSHALSYNSVTLLLTDKSHNCCWRSLSVNQTRCLSQENHFQRAAVSRTVSSHHFNFRLMLFLPLLPLNIKNWCDDLKTSNDFHNYLYTHIYQISSQQSVGSLADVFHRRRLVWINNMNTAAVFLTSKRELMTEEWGSIF